MTSIRLSSIIAPSFYSLHKDVTAERHTFYKLPGGRGSTKSTFVGVEIPLGIMRDAANGKMTNALVYRRYGVNLRDSVYEQLVWGIEKLKVSHLWTATLSPLKLIYKPTGQQILFRGADSPTKSKSIKVSKGYIKYLWFEELDEFEGPEKIRSIQQSVLRGGEKFTVFYSFNPPRSQCSWVNNSAVFTMPGMVTHHTTYLTVPREWLGEEFILEAEHLRDVNPKAYEHEYLGVATGTGGEVFENIRIESITEEQIASFEVVRRGLDEGYAIDPLAYHTYAYDRKKKTLYVFDELYGTGISNETAANEIKKKNPNNDPINADSAAPRFISEMRQRGLRVYPVKKGPDSIKYGIGFLQHLDAIVIDPVRCPNAAREFSEYELEKDAQGNFRADFPDRNNHSIDDARYAMERECQMWREQQKKPTSDPDNPTPEEKRDRMIEKITGGAPSIRI